MREPVFALRTVELDLEKVSFEKHSAARMPSQFPPFEKSATGRMAFEVQDDDGILRQSDRSRQQTALFSHQQQVRACASSEHHKGLIVIAT